MIFHHYRVAARHQCLSSISCTPAFAWARIFRVISPMVNRSYATGVQKPLVSVVELKEAIHSKTPPVVLDCTWFMPNIARDAVAEFQKKRIPGARFFNLDEVIDKTSPYPHMLPSPEDFAKAVGDLGITPEDNVCCYDTHGIFSAPRVWWTFKVFGHQTVSVLNGGLPAWQQAGGELETSLPKQYPSVVYPAPQKDESLVRSFEQMTELAKKGDKSVQILDARSAGRFHGNEPEPRKGLSSGHIPGSISLPFQNLIDQRTGQFYDMNHIRELLETQIDPSKDTITSCGTGVTASILFLGLEASGFPSKKSVYDGSWTEWASRHANDPDMIVKT